MLAAENKVTTVKQELQNNPRWKLRENLTKTNDAEDVN
jgi:hypothetical protein